MADEESMGALSALMNQRVEDDGMGKDTLAGYISDSVKATPLAPSQLLANPGKKINAKINADLDCAIDQVLGDDFNAEPRPLV